MVVVEENATVSTQGMVRGVATLSTHRAVRRDATLLTHSAVISERLESGVPTSISIKPVSTDIGADWGNMSRSMPAATVGPHRAR